MQHFRRTFNLAPVAMRALLERSAAVLPRGEQGLAFAAAHLRALEASLVATLRDFHAQAPQLDGMDMDRLLRAALPRAAQRERLAILRALIAAGGVAATGSLLRLPGHVPGAPFEHESLYKRLDPLFAQWGVNVPLVREVALRSAVEETALREFLKHRARSGEMVRVTAERYLPHAAVARLAETALGLTRAGPQRPFTVADFRDRAVIGRNLAIEILEYFDRLGYTQRSADGRAVRDPEVSIDTLFRAERVK